MERGSIFSDEVRQFPVEMFGIDAIGQTSRNSVQWFLVDVKMASDLALKAKT